LCGPITIAGDETKANHIADFGIGGPGVNGTAGTGGKELKPCRPKAK
jgi:hypothetical protein